MNNVSQNLPVKDEWTTYDYDVGAKRMADAKEGKFKFLELTDFDCPGMPFIINFSDQMEYMKSHPTTVTSKLWVTGPDDFSVELKRLTREKTIHFANKSIAKWGKEDTEKVISATQTGSLYFHMIHYFGSYDNYLEKMNQAAPSEEKRRKVEDE
jgi:hypothetical protein